MAGLPNQQQQERAGGGARAGAGTGAGMGGEGGEAAAAEGRRKVRACVWVGERKRCWLGALHAAVYDDRVPPAHQPTLTTRTGLHSTATTL